MEVFRGSLVNARKVVEMCKERERLKRNNMVLNVFDFEKQLAELTGKSVDIVPFEPIFKSIEEILRRKPVISRANAIKPPVVSADKQSHRYDEPPIAIENGVIVCRFEFAAIISAIAQRAGTSSVLNSTYSITDRIVHQTKLLFLLTLKSRACSMELIHVRDS